MSKSGFDRDGIRKRIVDQYLASRVCKGCFGQIDEFLWDTEFLHDVEKGLSIYGVVRLFEVHEQLVNINVEFACFFYNLPQCENLISGGASAPILYFVFSWLEALAMCFNEFVELSHISIAIQGFQKFNSKLATLHPLSLLSS